MEANYSMPTLPLTTGGAGFGSGEGFLPFLLGALFSGGGMFGGRNELNTAINANQSGEIAGLQAGIANIQRGQETSEVLGAISTTSSDSDRLLLRTNDALDTGLARLQGDIAGVATAQASGNFTTLQSINALGRDVQAGANQNALQNLNSFNALNTSMLQGFNTISADAAQNANQLIMGQNALSSQLSKCCCDLEKSVRDDGDKTRALINDLEVKRLTEALNDAKFQNNNQSQTNAIVAAMAQQTNTILSHIPVIAGASSSVVR